jgi:anionic cell wall polymer biosynthesis LytR-Cps2A-Psr (LCP) family protein
VGALSIPRDLWVTVPGYGENRINTAHFYAESEYPGYGPVAAMDTIRQILKPSAWLHIPAILFELPKTVDTDIPIWQWPRLGLAFVRTGPNGIDSRTINRDMVTPFTTTGGAMVLSPNWQKINPLLMDMFGQ